MQKFCPRCGKEVEKIFGPKGLCRECYSEVEDFVELPDEERFDQCPVCGSYKIENTWKDFESDQDLVFDILEKYDQGDEMFVDFRRQGERYEVEIVIEREENGEKVTQRKSIELIPEKKQCRKCSRFHGGYYEAIVQLRGHVTKKMFGEIMEHASNVTNQDRTHFISDVEEIHGGYDIYVSSKTMARKISEFVKGRRNAEDEWTRELVGEKEGERIYRSVISLRILE